MFRRDTHFAEVVEREVLAKGRKALLIAGSVHLVRRDRNGPTGGVLSLIEKRHPGAAYVILLDTGFWERNEELEPRLASWPIPSLAPLKGTWLGELDGRLRYRVVARLNGGKPFNPFEGVKLEETADAYLYVGPRDLLTEALPHPRIYQDAYWNELNRRRKLIGQPPLDDPEADDFNTSGRFYVRPRATPVAK